MADFFPSAKRKNLTTEISNPKRKKKFSPHSGQLLSYWAHPFVSSYPCKIAPSQNAFSFLEQMKSYALGSLGRGNKRGFGAAHADSEKGIWMPPNSLADFGWIFLQVLVGKVANLVVLIGCKHHLTCTRHQQRWKFKVWAQYCHPIFAEFCSNGRALR